MRINNYLPKYPNIDKYLNIIIKDVLNIDKNFIINIVHLKLTKSKNVEYKAILEHLITNMFTLYIKPGLSNNELKRILCHEAVHIKQFLENRLIITNDKIEFDGYVYDNPKQYYADIEYKDRPWEKEAFNMESKVLKSLNKYLKR